MKIAVLGTGMAGRDERHEDVRSEGVTMTTRRQLLGTLGALPAAGMQRGGTMTDEKPKSPYADIAPALGEYTDKVLFGDVWRRPGLSPRDRSLITVATLVALYRTNELPYHLKKAIENGVTRDELIELITHLAFYAGWPAANTAVTIARTALAGGEAK